MLNHLADILRMLARGDQQSIVGFNDDKVPYADRRDEFARRVNEVSFGVQRKALLRANYVLAIRT